MNESLWLTPVVYKGVDASLLFFKGVSHMMNKEPMFDSSDPEEPRKTDPPAISPKVAFQWPPDCVWPFIDPRCDRDT